MRPLFLALLLAAAAGPAASAQVGDVLGRAGDVLLIALQFEGLDAPARTSMAVGLGTALVVPSVALSSIDIGVSREVALSVALTGVVVGPAAGFAAAGSPRAGLVGAAVRAAAVGGTVVLLLRADLENAGLGGVVVVPLLLLPGSAVLTLALAIDLARLRSHLLAQTRQRARTPDRVPGVAFGLVSGGPGVALRVPLP